MKLFVFDHKKIAGSKRDARIKEVLELIKKEGFTNDVVYVFPESEWGDIFNTILSIRLALPFIGCNALNPIAIIKNPESKNDLMYNIYKRVKRYAEVLLTPGIEVYDSIEAINDSNKPMELSIEEYCNDFLPHIKVLSGEGSHSIANEWAAYNMGRLINENKSDIPASNDLLYLCYLLVNGMNNEQLQKLIENTTQAGDKDQKDQINKVTNKKRGKRKILLIDDQDVIWRKVIGQLVTGNEKDNNIELNVWGKDDIKFDQETPVVSGIKIDGKEDYQKDIILNYDVVLLDMRLAGNKEQHQDTENLSGIQVLKQILDEKDGNPGQRVIVFTSSNKAWNIKRCLEIGAQSVFIKESPMYPLQEADRIKDINTLIDDINKGLKYSWLKDVCRFSKAIIENCNKRHSVISETSVVRGSYKSLDALGNLFKDNDNKDNKLQLSFYEEVVVQIKIATKFFLVSDKEDIEQMRLAYISLEKVFELMSQNWIEHNNPKVVNNSNNRKTTSKKDTSQADKPNDDKSQEDDKSARRVITLIKEYGICDPDCYIEHAIERLIEIMSQKRIEHNNSKIEDNNSKNEVKNKSKKDKSQEDKPTDNKSQADDKTAVRVIKLIKEYGICHPDDYMERAIERLIIIRNDAIHKNKPKWWEYTLYKKNEPKLEWRLDENTKYEFIKNRDYVNSFRALMYLLYLIFCG